MERVKKKSQFISLFHGQRFLSEFEAIFRYHELSWQCVTLPTVHREAVS